MSDSVRGLFIRNIAFCCLAYTLAAQDIPVDLNGRQLSLANSDVNYRALRAGTLGETYRVQNLVLTRDVGKLTLRSGQVSFLAPVFGRTAIAVFTGDGQLLLKPAVGLETNYLQKLTGKQQVDEDFDSAVIYFTDSTYDEVKKSGEPATDLAGATEVLHRFQRQMRQRFESPRSFVEALYSDESIPNLEADLLGELYAKDSGSGRTFTDASTATFAS